jgi:hypothetical protein
VGNLHWPVSICPYIVGQLDDLHQEHSAMTKWLQDWFNQPSVQAGDPARRAIADVHKACSDQGQEIKREAVIAGWHVVATETHYVLIPSSGKVSVIC